TEHLKAADFFDVATYPQAVFSITDCKNLGDDNYEVSGDLEMRGVAKNITFPARATRSGEEIKVNAEFDINRKDWGIEYAGKKDDLIRNEVVLNLDLILEPITTENL
ncbi:MAG: YceI family protein, partial [Verrucomicrobiales bacterium]